MGFQQGLSGLNASSKALDTIGNNIANANTVGYKEANAVRGCLCGFAQRFRCCADWSWHKGQGVLQQFTQGNISVTNNPLDVAINGGGFFQMDDLD
jgi:flagellar hook protein FlgE